jgi:hypothetical protein
VRRTDSALVVTDSDMASTSFSLSALKPAVLDVLPQELSDEP